MASKPKYVVPDYSQEALDALARAVVNREPIGDLEFLDVPTRTLNAIEGHGITTIDQLLAVHPSSLLTIKNVGDKAIQQVLNGLAGYHMLSKMRNKALKKEMIPVRTANERRKMQHAIGAEPETDRRAIALDAEASRQEAIFRGRC